MPVLRQPQPMNSKNLVHLVPLTGYRAVFETDPSCANNVRSRSGTTDKYRALQLAEERRMRPLALGDAVEVEEGHNIRPPQHVRVDVRDGRLHWQRGMFVSRTYQEVHRSDAEQRNPW